MTTSPPSSSDSSGSSRAFDLLDEKVRRWIWRKGWNELRDVQEKAILEILGHDGDVILAAATASGKTEAAFLPICSQLASRDDVGIGIDSLYVGPLKALINDQFQRLESLCEDLEIPVHRWHGDVDSARKQKVLRDPSGILLITPESLEATFVLRGTRLSHLFSSLRCVVIDELHAFLSNERGIQLRSLLHRLELAIGRRVRRIGLSATLGDMRLAAEFLRPGEANDVTLIEGEGEGQELRLQVRGYERPFKYKRSETEPVEDAATPEDTEDERSIGLHLFSTLRGTNNLVFANRRSEVEFFADRLRRSCEEARVPNEFYPHHGSLSRELRMDVESALRKAEQPVTVVCTSTLEMGIDIGAVKSVAQIGPPPSVASLRQRLGRSGRRGEPAVIRMYVREEQLTPQSQLASLLRLQLVETIAMTELLLQRWCEPPDSDGFHFSTLIQQVLSLIAQRDGVHPKEAWGDLCKTGPFRNVTPQMFATLLRDLGSEDLVTQMKDGTLLLGVEGERMVNRYDFYASFVSADDYRLLHDGRLLGSIPIDHPITVGSPLIFAGRRWKVAAVEIAERVILVVPSHAGQPHFFGGGGSRTHDRVRLEMLRILSGAGVSPYLDSVARRLLEEARAAFARLGLHNQRIVREGGEIALLPWRGDRVTNTLAVLLQVHGIQALASNGLISIANAEATQLMDLLKRLSRQSVLDGRELAREVSNPCQEKHDGLLSECLLLEETLARDLDAAGALSAISDMTRANPAIDEDGSSGS